MRRKARQILKEGGTIVDGQVHRCEQEEGYWRIEFEIIGLAAPVQANSILIHHRPNHWPEGTKVKFLRDRTGHLFLL